MSAGARRSLGAAAAAVGSGLAAALALFAWSEGGALHREDALGVGTLALAGGAACVLLQHLALSMLRRRAPLRSAAARAAVAAGVVNAPLYALLLSAHLRGGAFAPGEAAIWAAVLAVTAGVFGALAR